MLKNLCYNEAWLTRSLYFVSNNFLKIGDKCASGLNIDRIINEETLSFYFVLSTKCSLISVNLLNMLLRRVEMFNLNLNSERL